MLSVHKITSSKMSSHFSEVKKRAQNTSEYPCPSAVDKPSIIRVLKNFSTDPSSGSPLSHSHIIPVLQGSLEWEYGSMGDGWLGVTRKAPEGHLVTLDVPLLGNFLPRSVSFWSSLKSSPQTWQVKLRLSKKMTRTPRKNDITLGWLERKDIFKPT